MYQGRNRGCSYRQDNYRSRKRSYSRDLALNTIEEEEIIVTEVTGLIIEQGVNQDQEITMEIEGMTGLIKDQSYRRQNFRQDCGEQSYRARSISQDQDRSRQ